jgi:predicted transcriptional regulator of viral defense system
MKQRRAIPDPLAALGALGTLVSTRDLQQAGLNSMAVTRLVRTGHLLRLGRGVYQPAGAELPGRWTLKAVAMRAPDTLFCLLTALELHGLTTQSPSEVWIALGNHDHAPRMDYPPLRVARFAPASLTEGVQTLELDKTTIHVTNPAKTVADCFKHRGKVGLDVALEALREARRTGVASQDKLWHYAQLDRVQNVMRPYLEAVT